MPESFKDEELIEPDYRVPLGRPKLLIPAILLGVTMITTTAAGALYEGMYIFKYPALMVHGIPFSASLLLILGIHELGHYLASRRHGVATTLPLFIPGPPIPPMIGTFGAVIKIQSPITRKHTLVDIGAAGPLAGFVAAVIVTAIGLYYSSVVPIEYSEGSLGLGNSIIIHGLSYLILGPMPPGYDVVLHPIAFAGWIGFFVTAMNLLPIGQLDGGHLVYALIGRQPQALLVADDSRSGNPRAPYVAGLARLGRAHYHHSTQAPTRRRPARSTRQRPKAHLHGRSSRIYIDFHPHAVLYYRCMKIFDEEELKKYDGAVLGKPIYFAYKGKVYNATKSPLFLEGMHFEHFAGTDLTDFMEDAPHDDEPIEELEVVGEYKE